MASQHDPLLARAWRPTAVIVAIIAGAEIAQRLSWLPVYIPPPSAALANVIAKPSLLFANLGPTVGRAAAGFCIAAFLTFAAASVAALLRPLQGAVYNFGAILHSMPIIATAPLLAL